MIDAAAALLAKLADDAAPSASWGTIFFGKVTASTSTSVTVVPDTSADGTTIGPMPLIGTNALTIGDRACCVMSRGGASVACIGKVL